MALGNCILQALDALALYVHLHIKAVPICRMDADGRSRRVRHIISLRFPHQLSAYLVPLESSARRPLQSSGCRRIELCEPEHAS